MRHLALQTLTWGTVAAAVVSAFWLASVDLGWSEWRNPFANGDSVFEAPSEPTQAGHVRAPAPREERGGQHETLRNTR
jgi:hypothetical protein